MMADGSLLRSGGETWGPVSPTMFTKQVSRSMDSPDPPHRGRGGAAGRATRRKTWSRPRSEVFVPFTSEGRERRPPPSREGQLGRGILPSCHPRPDHPKVLEEEIGGRG
jgi:hypothetical protein